MGWASSIPKGSPVFGGTPLEPPRGLRKLEASEFLFSWYRPANLLFVIDDEQEVFAFRSLCHPTLRCRRVSINLSNSSWSYGFKTRPSAPCFSTSLRVSLCDEALNITTLHGLGKSRVRVYLEQVPEDYSGVTESQFPAVAALGYVVAGLRAFPPHLDDEDEYKKKDHRWDWDPVTGY